MASLLSTSPAQIDEVEVKIAVALHQDSAWASAAERLQSLKGIGWVTAAWTLVSSLNLTPCDTVDSWRADAGRAPMRRQSGSRVGHRPSIGHSGNGRLRSANDMASLMAARFNPVIHTFDNRLREAGKPEKVARCAAARKRLHRACAVMINNQPFDPNDARG